MMKKIRSSIYWTAAISFVILPACSGGSGVDDNTDRRPSAIEFSAPCEIPPRRHQFKTNTDGEVIAWFKQLQPATGTGARINLRSDDVDSLGIFTGVQVKEMLPAGNYSFAVSHNHGEPLCTYTVEVVIPI